MVPGLGSTATSGGLFPRKRLLRVAFRSRVDSILTVICCFFLKGASTALNESNSAPPQTVIRSIEEDSLLAKPHPVSSVDAELVVRPIAIARWRNVRRLIFSYLSCLLEFIFLSIVFINSGDRCLILYA